MQKKKREKIAYAKKFTPFVYFLTYFSSECTQNYARVKTGNLYMANLVNGCCECTLSGERSWDDEDKLNRWNFHVHFAKKVSTFVLKR